MTAATKPTGRGVQVQSAKTEAEALALGADPKMIADALAKQNGEWPLVIFPSNPPGKPAAVFTLAEWTVFRDGVKNGDFDDLSDPEINRYLAAAVFAILIGVSMFVAWKLAKRRSTP
jgi:hypothetical protein